jgi:hypothetical protein
MAEEQAALAANLHILGLVLESIEGGVPWIHLGVVTADPADGGALQGGFLYDVAVPDGSRERNYDGPLADALVGLGLVGTSGADVAQPLKSMQLALDGSSPGNEGFLRETAPLYVGFITTQDDGSPDEPQDYGDFLKGLKEDDRAIIVGGAFGDAAGVPAECDAAPGVRLQAVLDEFPDRSSFSSICGEDWSPMFELLAQRLAIVLGVPCLDGQVDVDDVLPAEIGLQLECSVSDVQDLGTEDEEATVIRRCDMQDDTTPSVINALPCWWAEIDPTLCQTESSVIVRIERGEWFPPGGTTVVVRCRGTGCL